MILTTGGVPYTTLLNVITGIDLFVFSSGTTLKLLPGWPRTQAMLRHRTDGRPFAISSQLAPASVERKISPLPVPHATV